MMRYTIEKALQNIGLALLLVKWEAISEIIMNFRCFRQHSRTSTQRTKSPSSPLNSKPTNAEEPKWTRTRGSWIAVMANLRLQPTLLAVALILLTVFNLAVNNGSPHILNTSVTEEKSGGQVSQGHTGTNKKACTLFREFCFCSCLYALPGLAWVLLSNICILFSRSL